MDRIQSIAGALTLDFVYHRNKGGNVGVGTGSC